MAETELRANEIRGATSTTASASADAAIRIPRLRWLIIGLVFLATLINYIDRLTVSVLAPVITEALKLSNLQYASLGTWFLLAYTISQGLSGRLYDRIGARRGFALSITMWSLAAMAHAMARGLGSLSAFRFLLGLGEAGNWPGAAKVIAEWFPVRERAFAMAIFNSGAAIGSIVAPPLIVWLQLRYGWQATFVVTGALGFFWLALWLLCYQPPDRHRWLSSEEFKLIREGQRDGETERQSDGGMEGQRDRGTERQRDKGNAPPSLRLSVSPSLRLSIPPSLCLRSGENCCATNRSGPSFCRGCWLIPSGGCLSLGCRCFCTRFTGSI
jgi:ACS family hexuronate transporter-like MFS transporter